MEILVFRLAYDFAEARHSVLERPRCAHRFPGCLRIPAKQEQVYKYNRSNLTRLIQRRRNNPGRRFLNQVANTNCSSERQIYGRSSGYQSSHITIEQNKGRYIH